MPRAKKRRCEQTLNLLDNAVHGSLDEICQLDSSIKSSLLELKSLKKYVAVELSRLICHMNNYHKKTGHTARLLKGHKGCKDALTANITDLENELHLEKTVCDHYKQAVYDLEAEMVELETHFSELQLELDDLENENKSLTNKISSLDVESLQSDKVNMEAARDVFRNFSPGNDLLSNINSIKRCIQSLKEYICDADDVEDGICVVCKTKNSTSACFPCGHLCLCQYCSPKVLDKKCPYCREPLESCQRVYIV